MKNGIFINNYKRRGFLIQMAMKDLNSSSCEIQTWAGLLAPGEYQKYCRVVAQAVSGSANPHLCTIEVQFFLYAAVVKEEAAKR